MPQIKFLPGHEQFEVASNVKILAVAIRNKVDIRYGCASCRCGTCGIRIIAASDTHLSEMRPNEKELLEKMALPIDGSIRLACQTRLIDGSVTVDLTFQNEYSPDQGEDDWD